MRYIGNVVAIVALASACLSLWAASASAADNSRIIVIEKNQRSTPFGNYRSERETQVYGPSSGFRYEQYSAPGPSGVIVSPYGYGVAPRVACCGFCVSSTQLRMTTRLMRMMRQSKPLKLRWKT